MQAQAGIRQEHRDWIATCFQARSHVIACPLQRPSRALGSAARAFCELARTGG